MRRSLPLLVLLLATAAACGQMDDRRSSSDPGMPSEIANATPDAPAEMVAPPGRASRETGPDLQPGSAPGVAFQYRYGFRLEADRVAEAQQEHQRLCERYTIARCRITGMSYRAVDDEDVEAMLALRVDPAIAGQFGRESVQAVVGADGRLTDSEITGQDVGSALQSTGRSLAELTARLTEVEERLRNARLGAGDKGQLEYEAQLLRQQIRDLRATREGQQQSLATTPILFRYGSGDLAPGPTPPPSLGETVRETGGDFLYSLTILLIVLVRLLPWAMAGLLGWCLFRFVRRCLSSRGPAGGIEPALSA